MVEGFWPECRGRLQMLYDQAECASVASDGDPQVNDLIVT